MEESGNGASTKDRTSKAHYRGTSHCHLREFPKVWYVREFKLLNAYQNNSTRKHVRSTLLWQTIGSLGNNCGYFRFDSAYQKQNFRFEETTADLLSGAIDAGNIGKDGERGYC